MSRDDATLTLEAIGGALKGFAIHEQFPAPASADNLEPKFREEDARASADELERTPEPKQARYFSIGWIIWPIAIVLLAPLAPLLLLVFVCVVFSRLPGRIIGG
jgi:hypothetical protein